jgi:ion channel-forming bestrophin family protein
MVTNNTGQPYVCSHRMVPYIRSATIQSNNTTRLNCVRVLSDTNPEGPADLDQNKARVLIEKKTAINLLEAFAVAVKHYLRGEDGIYYADLYHLVKFLPPYAFPSTIPSAVDISDPISHPLDPNNKDQTRGEASPGSPKLERTISDDSILSKQQGPSSVPHLPLPITSPTKKPSFIQPPPTLRSQAHQSASEKPRSSVGVSVEGSLLPARMPPKYAYLDLFPFSLLVKGRNAGKLRAKMQTAETQNVPLEISLYLVCVATILCTLELVC